ncbi:MAG: glycosyltransferase family 4 protein [Gammaproteobacteria bacterium]
MSSTKKRKVLITVPTLHSKGGVSNYYRTIRDYLSVGFDFFTVGPFRWEKRTQLERVRKFLSDPVRFKRHLKEHHADYDLTMINPSFEYGSLIREALLLRVAKKQNKKTIVFFRGFDMDNAAFVDKYFKKLFFASYCKTDCFIVLGEEFRDCLVDWGFKQPVVLETTLVDDKLLEGFSLDARLARIDNGEPAKLLFLSRIVKEKGVMEALQAFKLLVKANDRLTLTMAGDGPMLDEAKQYAKDNGLEDKISFPGFVSGDEKRRVLTDADMYIFPSYTEGMPNSVLEAMAFGLPVVATPVGGIKDVVKKGEHGFLLDENTPEAIAAFVEKIIGDRDLQKSMSSNCFASGSGFLASRIAERLEEIFENVIEQD